ncbi:MAG: thioredoxin family protein [Deltaproteobacteria bacterium]|nr:thioredoxin family protein [Deltaproteobacteria bacterium]
MKKFLAIIGFIFLGFVIYLNYDARVNKELEAPRDPNWFYDAVGYDEALDLELKTHQTIVVYFYTDWCPYCKRFDDDVLTSYETKNYLDSVIKVRINPERGTEERDIYHSFGVRGYPTVFVFPKNAEDPFKILNTSLQTPEDFIKACKDVEGDKGVMDKLKDALIL